jgi:PAS domain S-box-containing protein
MSNNQSSFDQRTDFNPQSVTAAEQLNDYFLQAPVAIAVVTRDDYRFAVANNKYLHTIGRRREEIINRPAFEVMPELKDQLKHLLDQVIESGKGFQATEYKIENYVNGILQTDYYSFSYEPIRGRDGIINAIFISGYNVTEQVQTKVSLQQSETQLRLVADALPVLISYVDKDERYQFNNKWYEHWFGESRDRVKGQTMRQLLGDKAYEAIQPYVKRALSGERFSYESKVHYRKHGETYIHATYIPDISNNEVRGFYALVEDVTKRRLADDKIRESELHFRRMADTVPSIIWVTDKDGYCTYLNKHWYECTGQTEQEALGFGWLKATHPEDAPATEITFLDANTKQVEFNSTYRLRFADGKYRWVIDRGKPRYGHSSGKRSRGKNPRKRS